MSKLNNEFESDEECSISNNKNDDQITNIENKTNLINIDINDLEELSNKIKQKLNNENVNNDVKEKLLTHKNNIDDELLLLNIYNLKYKKYLDILKEKHKLELEYIEEMCIQESKKERLSDKYNFINLIFYFLFIFNCKYTI